MLPESKAYKYSLMDIVKHIVCLELENSKYGKCVSQL